MFEQAFVEGVGKTNRSWTVTLSFGLEFAFVGLMILIPVIWTDMLPKGFQVSMLIAPAPPPPPPPAQRVLNAVKAVPRRFSGWTPPVPNRIPPTESMANDQPVALNDTAINDASPLSGFLDSLGAIQAGGPGIGQAPRPPVVPASQPKDPPARQEGPYRQSSGVQAARCINCPKPKYPPFARQARIQGAVVLQAVISKDGTVKRLTVLSPANPILNKAATDAVGKWVYTPTILNQEPVEVITEITVNFELK